MVESSRGPARWIARVDLIPVQGHYAEQLDERHILVGTATYLGPTTPTEQP